MHVQESILLQSVGTSLSSITKCRPTSNGLDLSQAQAYIKRPRSITKRGPKLSDRTLSLSARPSQAVALRPNASPSQVASLHHQAQAQAKRPCTITKRGPSSSRDSSSSSQAPSRSSGWRAFTQDDIVVRIFGALLPASQLSEPQLPMRNCQSTILPHVACHTKKLLCIRNMVIECQLSVVGYLNVKALGLIFRLIKWILSEDFTQSQKWRPQLSFPPHRSCSSTKFKRQFKCRSTSQGT